MINSQIQNYKIISLLGEGGMGNVYLGEHVSIKRKVAIKVLKPELAKNEEIRLRFKNEASMLAHLQHPNIVGLIDYVEQEDGLFLIMEYVDGKGLDQLIREQQTPLRIERSIKIMTQILHAFLYAHQNGIVHRDVKPSNILITSDDRIKVLDFGIAKLVGERQHNLTKTGTQIGTVYYMSPEQVTGSSLDQRSDIYSLGVTFYELLSGVCPYRGMTTEYEIFDSIVKKPLLPLDQTMGGAYTKVWNVIDRATQKDRESRFQNCEEFMTGLEKGVDPVSKPQAERKVKGPASAESESRSKNWIIISLILIAISGLGFLLWGDNEPAGAKWKMESGRVEEGQDYSIYYSYYASGTDSLLPYQIKVNEVIREFVMDNSFITDTNAFKELRVNKDFFIKVLKESKTEADKLSSEYGSSIMDSIYIDTNFNVFDQVIMSMYGYQAGGTGWASIRNTLIDKNSARVLGLGDFISDMDAFTGIAERCFRKQNGLVGYDGFGDEFTFENSKFYCPKNFCFVDGNFSFTYDKYEISYGAAGCVNFKVPIAEVSHLLKIDLGTKTPMNIVAPKEAEIQPQPMSQEEVSRIMTNYYNDIVSDNFDANNYYAMNVNQFIKRTNLTADDINELNQSSDDMTERSILLDAPALTFDRTSEDIQYFRYSIYFVCYRPSKGKYQSCNVKIEVGFNAEKRLKVYRELNIENLTYTDYNPNEVGD